MDINEIESHLDSLSLSELENLYGWLGEYEQQPVDIKTFLDDPEYLGDYFSGTLRPYWRQVLYDIYPSPHYSPYWLVCLRGAIGLGKTTISTAAVAYELHKLLCYINPQKSLGVVPTSKIVFAIFNRTLSLSSDVVWDRLSQAFTRSPYFNRMLGPLGTKNKTRDTIFPKRIDFTMGSRIGHTLGGDVYCLSGDTRIPMLDGSVKTIRQIHDEKIRGYLTYSCDINSKEVVPGNIIKSRFNGLRETYRIYFDNGTYVDSTVDHKFLMRNNRYKEVKDIKIGDSLLHVDRYCRSKYELLVNPYSGLVEPTHRVVARWKVGNITNQYVVHHKDYDSRNNAPNNLMKITKRDHILFHSRSNYFSKWKLTQPDRYKQACNNISQHVKTAWFNKKNTMSEQEYQVYCKRYTNEFSSECRELISNKSKLFWNTLDTNKRVELLSVRGNTLSNSIRNNWDKHKDRILNNLSKTEEWVNSDDNKGHIRQVSKMFRESPDYSSSRDQHKQSMNNYWNSTRANERKLNQAKVMSGTISEYFNSLTDTERQAHAISNYRSKILKCAYRNFGTGPVDYLAFHYKESSINKYFGSKSEFEHVLSNYNYKVVKIEYIGYTDVYDITVEKYHNFVLENGIVSHNCSIMDEANFEVVEGQTYDAFNSIIARMQSRFMKPGGGLPGKLFLVSSESDKFSTMNRVVDQRKSDKGVYISQAALWEVVTHKNGLPVYSGKTFPVFIGSETKQPEIIGRDSKLLITEPDLCIEVPVEHQDRFESDLIASLRDLAGRSTGSTYKLFRLKDRLYSSMVITPVFPDVIQLDFDDEDDQILNYCNVAGFFDVPVNHPRYIHIDIALSGDRLGLSASYVRGFRERKTRDINTFQELTEIVPEVMTEWATTIEAVSGKQIPLYKIRSFILQLSQKGYMIGKVTADLRMLSADTLQGLKKSGVDAEYLSVDKTVTPYLTIRSMVYEGRHLMPASDLLKKEMSELEMTPDGTKVDHPKDGSKDMSDSICGSAYVASLNADRNVLFYMPKENTISSEVIETFWKVR